MRRFEAPAASVRCHINRINATKSRTVAASHISDDAAVVARVRPKAAPKGTHANCRRVPNPERGANSSTRGAQGSKRQAPSSTRRANSSAFRAQDSKRRAPSSTHGANSSAFRIQSSKRRAPSSARGANSSEDRAQNPERRAPSSACEANSSAHGALSPERRARSSAREANSLEHRGQSPLHASYRLKRDKHRLTRCLRVPADRYKHPSRAPPKRAQTMSWPNLAKRCGAIALGGGDFGSTKRRFHEFLATFSLRVV